MNKMSDKTFGVKVSEELYEKVKSMIDVSGVSSKDWFEKAVALTAVQNLKDGSGAYKQDLSELEIHTTRIYELVGNMINRAEYLKMDAVKELEGKLESRELTITELQGSVKKLTEDLKQLEEESKQSASDKKELSEQVESFRSANDNNQALIQEYKEKIDTLSSLVNEYKGYATENAELKEKHSAEKEQMKADFGEKESRMTSSIEELKSTARDQATLIEQLQEGLDKTVQHHQNELDNQKVNFENQLTQLTDRKDLERDRAILEIERKYQEKLEKIHEQYNEKLAGLYERLETKEKPKNEK
jgi:DNA repair exonuclease SbcCD ATPase subunit